MLSRHHPHPSQPVAYNTHGPYCLPFVLPCPSIMSTPMNACHFLLGDADMQKCIVHTCCRRMLDGCPSHTGIVSNGKRYHQTFFSALYPYYYGFLIPHYCCKILVGRVTCHSGGLRIFSLIKTHSNGSAV